MKMRHLFLTILSFVIASACGGLEDLDKTDEQLFKEELIKIDDWLVKNGLTAETTPEGIRYVIQRNAGFAKATFGNTVITHYTGKTLNNAIFDSSVNRGPFTFQLGNNSVIQGWEIGFKLLGKEDQAILLIPSRYGYGRSGVGSIPPNSVLIFTVDVVDVK